MGRLGGSLGRLAGAERGGSAGTPSEPYDFTNGGTVTGDLTLNGHLIMGAGKVVKIADGTVAAPGLAFGSDLDNGIYRIGANDWALSAGGVAVQEQIATLVKQLVALGISDGTVGAPGLAFTADLDNGLYRTAANAWSLAAGGGQGLGLAASLLTAAIDLKMAANRQLQLDDGALGAPGLAFAADLDTGFIRTGANVAQRVAGGAAVEEWGATYLQTLLKQGFAMGSQNIAVVGDTILSGNSFVALTNTSGGSLTLTSTPTIAAGTVNGQILIVQVLGSFSIVLQDETGLAGCKLRNTSASSKTVTTRDTIVYIWAAAAGEWNQVVALTAL